MFTSEPFGVLAVPLLREPPELRYSAHSRPASAACQRAPGAAAPSVLPRCQAVGPLPRPYPNVQRRKPATAPVPRRAENSFMVASSINSRAAMEQYTIGASFPNKGSLSRRRQRRASRAERHDCSRHRCLAAIVAERSACGSRWRAWEHGPLQRCRSQTVSRLAAPFYQAGGAAKAGASGWAAQSVMIL